MKNVQCQVVPSADTVIKKIQELEMKFAQAHNWENKTEQAVREQNGEEIFQNLVVQHYKCFLGFSNYG